MNLQFIELAELLPKQNNYLNLEALKSEINKILALGDSAFAWSSENLDLIFENCANPNTLLDTPNYGSLYNKSLLSTVSPKIRPSGAVYRVWLSINHCKLDSSQVQISELPFSILALLITRQVFSHVGICLASEVENLVVEPTYRRRGVATGLLQYVLSCLKSSLESDQDILLLDLEVRKSNSSAINLYLKNGFKEVGVRPNYYNIACATKEQGGLSDDFGFSEDAILMTCSLEKN